MVGSSDYTSFISYSYQQLSYLPADATILASSIQRALLEIPGICGAKIGLCTSLPEIRYRILREACRSVLGGIQYVSSWHVGSFNCHVGLGKYTKMSAWTLRERQDMI